MQRPDPGGSARADCGGLRFGLTACPSRLFDLLRGQEHTVLPAGFVIRPDGYLGCALRR
ncbi:hypothetical protein [Streptomyces sioyaensis]|uniref:hypothetical protein n=1 Tax=Streptomyces sioyaensis TaxID=67364 RepID=UPI0037A7B60E